MTRRFSKASFMLAELPLIYIPSQYLGLDRRIDLMLVGVLEELLSNAGYINMLLLHPQGTVVIFVFSIRASVSRDRNSSTGGTDERVDNAFIVGLFHSVMSTN
ncbi:hypothetical protein EVAR_14607_1 [Eumeta japonica]|uniref:Uncharacterized protein n=1 Tax=Eumeta variegata TaxID=151549 RepID=A0A4C1UUH4_EUMVA|nr:hypothetical protein EVAR_14607_1 [Eumeta japonica]